MAVEWLGPEESRKYLEEVQRRIALFQEWLLKQPHETERLAKPEAAILRTFILWERFYEDSDSGSADDQDRREGDVQANGS